MEKRKRIKPRKIRKTCFICGKEFLARNTRAVYCSNYCAHYLSGGTYNREIRDAEGWLREKAADIRLLQLFISQREEELDTTKDCLKIPANKKAFERFQKEIFNEMRPAIKKIYELRFKFYQFLGEGFSRKEQDLLYNYFIYDVEFNRQEIRALLLRLYHIKKGDYYAE